MTKNTDFIKYIFPCHKMAFMGPWGIGTSLLVWWKSRAQAHVSLKPTIRELVSSACWGFHTHQHPGSARWEKLLASICQLSGKPRSPIGFLSGKCLLRHLQPPKEPPYQKNSLLFRGDFWDRKFSVEVRLWCLCVYHCLLACPSSSLDSAHPSYRPFAIYRPIVSVSCGQSPVGNLLMSLVHKQEKPFIYGYFNICSTLLTGLFWSTGCSLLQSSVTPASLSGRLEQSPTGHTDTKAGLPRKLLLCSDAGWIARDKSGQAFMTFPQNTGWIINMAPFYLTLSCSVDTQDYNLSVQISQHVAWVHYSNLYQQQPEQII